MSHDTPEYMTLAEAAGELGIKRASIYYYIKEMQIETKRYPHNKFAYIARQDVERIKAVKEKPWTISEAKSDKSDKDAA